MKIEQVLDDSKIWRKGAVGNQEVVELMKQMETWELGNTFEVTLEKPFKSLRTILKRGLSQNKNVSVKKKDDTFTVWYIRVDEKTVPLKKKVRQRKANTEKEETTLDTNMEKALRTAQEDISNQVKTIGEMIEKEKNVLINK